MNYTELQVTTNFSFLRGGSHPQELIEQAALNGCREIAITDRTSLAGIVRAHVAAKANGIRMITGCRLDLKDGASLLAYPTNKDGYANLCSILSKGNLRTEKGKCDIYKADVYEHAKGIKFIVIPPASLNNSFDFEDDFKKIFDEYYEALGNDLYIATTRYYQSDDFKRLFRLSQLSKRSDIPLIATNDVHYHNPARRELQDILTCIREKRTIYSAGYLLHQNAERYLKPVDEMHRLFRQYNDAIKRTQELAEACQFSLDDLKFVYPQDRMPDGRTQQETLEDFTWQCAKDKFGGEIPEKIRKAIDYELAFIKKKNIAFFFLKNYEIVRESNNRKILCQGRGSAANSCVCYCLGITNVNPTKFDLLFERFVSDARDEPPDIDVDFEHERREEIIQYIYEKETRERAAIVATVTTMHAKGAIRDVGKAMGLSVDTINRLSKCIWEFADEWFDNDKIKEQGINPKDPHLNKILHLTKQYIGFPRQLGQHTGGFVICQDKLSNLCAIMNARMENRTCIEWDKDDIDALGFLKMDVLGLGMLTCIRKCFELAKEHYNKEFTLSNLPEDDPAVYDMISAADTIGVFQIESRAQQSMLPRLKPKCFYDLVIEVAIVRPGPIQGDMVHRYLRRRNGLEPVDYPSPEIKQILEKTLGIPLFQEQAMRLAAVAAGFTPTEADALRKSMATFKSKGLVKHFQERLRNGMLKKGYSKDYAERILKQLEGFGSYGFPESHAASFAHLVYISAWLKCYYPDVFACGLLNSLPMGFYAPAQIVGDARKHGVEAREVDINYSFWDNTLEEKANKYCALRLGFRNINGMREEDINKLVSARKKMFASVNEVLDIAVPISALIKLADADAFRSIGLDRRRALWEVTALRDSPIGLFRGQPSESLFETNVSLPEMSLSEHVVYDYSTLSLSIKEHPVSFLREKLAKANVIAIEELSRRNDGDIVRVAGLVLVRQRPGTAAGICFMTIEDETGNANLVVFKNLFENIYRKEILQSKLIMVEGKVQKEGAVIHVIVRHCENWSKLLRDLTENNKLDVQVHSLSPRDEKDGAPFKAQKPMKKQFVQEELFPDGRNFR
ncbi:MAG: error-prone DNA polymerase [Bacteroidetes bacterium]|nr:MAG: error-prone DNA polymerase [Bacteroidota bacterium]